MPTVQGKRWCFTLNNPTNVEKGTIADFFRNGTLPENGQVVYAVVGREVGESGTPHLQGFIIFSTNQRLTPLRGYLGNRAHLELARGTSVQARDYCKKDGDYDEYGTFPMAQGRRSDLDELIQWADDFAAENGRPADSPDVAKSHPKALIKYPRFTRTMRLRCQRALFDPVQFNEWQRELEEKLNSEPDDRIIDFIVDPEGGKGKTTFCRQFLQNNPDKTQILSIGKASDLAHAIATHNSVFLFNIPRGKMEFISYDLLEQLKDRVIFSGKYNSHTKILRNKCHIVVFSNEAPDVEKLSPGRMNIRII